MDEVAEFEDVGEQFRFLLQPVRDLSKNWDIDIKHYLDDYMKKLVHESEEPDELDGHKKRKLFNFAEAAVVIDGSTSIYSKKVDYLLQQAQGCLTLISVGKEIKNRKRKGEGEDGEGGEGGVDNGGGDDCFDSDDEDPDEKRRRKNPFLNPLTSAQEEHMSFQLQKLSKPRPCFPIVPLAFTPLVDYEKTNVVIFNRNEMVGKKDDFKVNTCQIVDGVALIDLKNLELLDMFTQVNVEYFLNPSIQSLLAERESLEADIDANDRLSIVKTIMSNAENIDENLENIDPAGHESFNGDYFDDLSDDDLASELKDISGANSTQPKGDYLHSQSVQNASAASSMHLNSGFAQVLEHQMLSQNSNSDQTGANNSLQNQYNNSLSGNRMSTADCVLTQHSSVGSNCFELTNPGAAYNLRPSSVNFHASTILNGELDQSTIESALVEPFEPLDPFEFRSENSKPFVLNSKCTVLAEKQVKQRNRRIDKECQKKGVLNIPMVKTYIDSRMFRRKIGKKSYAFAQFNSFLMDQALLSLNSQFYKEEKRRTEIRKKREADAKMVRRLARRTSQRTSLLHGESIARGTSLFAPISSPPHANYEDPTEELGADDIIDYNEPDCIEDKPYERPLGDILSVDDLGEQNLGAYNANLNVGRRKSVLLRNENFYDDTIYMGGAVDYPDELPPRPLSQLEYNELVEYHLKKYWTIKEEATSKFCERVRNWEDKVTPLLEEELSHREFNTRDYSTDIINYFEEGLGSELDFSKFAKNAVDYDLSRYLLVSLILTNMQNVKVVNSNVNELKLQLLKLERHDEVFDNEQKLITGG